MTTRLSRHAKNLPTTKKLNDFKLVFIPSKLLVAGSIPAGVANFKHLAFRRNRHSDKLLNLISTGQK